MNTPRYIQFLKGNALNIAGVTGTTAALAIIIWFTFLDVKKLTTPIDNDFMSLATTAPFIYLEGPINVIGKKKIYDPFGSLDKTVKGELVHPTHGTIEVSIDFSSHSNAGEACFENFNFDFNFEKNELIAFASGSSAKNLSENDIKTCAHAVMKYMKKRYESYLSDEKTRKENDSRWEHVVPEFVKPLINKD